MTKFKSDNRPSDTKSVVLHRERDRRLLEHLRLTKGESGFWRAAGNFYLDFMTWLATQPDAPAPDQAFVYYQRWLEARPSVSLSSSAPAPVDPESVAAAILPAMRAVIEAALETYRAGAGASAAMDALKAVEVEELADLFSSELVLE